MNDNVKSRIDIVYSKKLDSTILQLFQLPFNQAKCFKNNLLVKNKITQNKYEFDIHLDTENPNYSKGRAANFTHALRDPEIENSMRSTKLVTKTVDDKNQFCVGVFKNGKLYITPISSVIQLVPSFEHINAIDKARKRKEREAAAGQKGEESSSQDESTDKQPARKTQAITVKFGKNESAELKAKRRQTFPYLKEIWDTEPWIHLTYLERPSPVDVFSKLFSSDRRTSSKNAVALNRWSYLETVLPKCDNETTTNVANSEPYAPSNVLNVETLKSMSIMNKIIAIMKNAAVVRYSQLITLLGNRAEKDNVISCLKKVAVLVRGCWVISSEVLYPEKSVSSTCGVNAYLMRRGRDYILWRMNRNGFVMRKEMCSHTKLPGEEVRGILSSISELNSETGWEFIYPMDTFFLDGNRGLRDEYRDFWHNRGKELCGDLGLPFKSDHSPRRSRTRNISTDSSGGSASPASDKRRRRKNSTKSSAKDELSLLVENMDSESFRRTHSSPSESHFPEKFLADEEIKVMQNRMENCLLIKVSDFRAIISRITSKTMNVTEYGKAARDLDFFEVPIKGEAKGSLVMSYCARPAEFSNDEKLLLARCAAMLSSKGFITMQSVPKLIAGIDVDKTTLEKVLKQLCLPRDKRWMPKFLGFDQPQGGEIS